MQGVQRTFLFVDTLCRYERTRIWFNLDYPRLLTLLILQKLSYMSCVWCARPTRSPNLYANPLSASKLNLCAPGGFGAAGSSRPRAASLQRGTQGGRRQPS